MMKIRRAALATLALALMTACSQDEAGRAEGSPDAKPHPRPLAG